MVPAIALSVFAVVVALVVFVVARLRAGAPLAVSPRTILLAYFYLMTIASLLIFTSGVSVGLKALLSDAFGREFSYFMPPSVRIAKPPSPSEAIPGRPPEPTPEDRERARQQVERQYKDDLIQGITFTVVGAVLWGLHQFGRRRLGEGDPDWGPFLDRTYSTIILGIFSIVGIISLPASLFELLRYFLLPGDEFMPRSTPGGPVGIALVFVPVWGILLYRFFSRTRGEGQ